MTDHFSYALLSERIALLAHAGNLIPAARKQLLRQLAEAIRHQLAVHGRAQIIFVCTHNSRRSQLAQLWLHAAARHDAVKGIVSYSGGTEATAFNPRMVDALVRYGFQIMRTTDADNPRYVARVSEDDDGLVMFSKRYDDPFNPQQDFIAVMVCSQADGDCPVVPGAVARISLPYDDPKAYDGASSEFQAYDDTVREVGREMVFVARLLKAA